VNIVIYKDGLLNMAFRCNRSQEAQWGQVFFICSFLITFFHL
jgi:hypothetical protein